MATPPLAKRRHTLRSLAGSGGISDSALARVLGIVNENEHLFGSAPGTKPHRTTITRAVVDTLLREIGEEKHDLSLRWSPDAGTSFSWSTVTPQRILGYFANNSEQFRQILSELSDRCKTTWNLVLYTDEISPGAILRPIIKKKSHVWYITILELRDRLCRTDLWIPIALLRSSIVSRLPGGLSAATRLLLRSMCLGPRAIGNAGLCLRHSDGGHRLIHLRMGRILADEDALSSLWSIKGASGTVPCGIKCMVVAKQRGSRHLPEDNPDIVDLTCSDFKQITLNEDTDIWLKADMLQESCVGNNAHHTVLEQAFGITYCAEGILADAELRPVVSPTKSNRFDAMHILFSNGIVAVEIHLFMLWLEETHDLNYEAIGKHAQNFRYPNHVDKPKDVFSRARIKKNKKSFKAMAGEILSVYPLFRDFVEGRNLPHSAQIDSLMKLFSVLDLIKEAQYLASAVAPPENVVRLLVARLLHAIEMHSIAFKQAHGVEAVIPKHHMLFHVPEQILADVLLLWCFTPGRVNFLLKSCCEETDCTSRMESVGLARALNAQLRKLEEWYDFLKPPINGFPELAEALGVQLASFSRAATFKSGKLHAADIFILRGALDKADKCFQVKFCACAGDRKFVFLQWCHSPERVTTHACRWRLAVDVDVLELEDSVVLHPAPCWRVEAAGTIVCCHF